MKLLSPIFKLLGVERNLKYVNHYFYPKNKKIHINYFMNGE